MARAVAERASRKSAPQTVDADLSKLWRDAGRSGPIARAIMSNLVVFRRAETEAASRSRRRYDMPVDAVAARHPSRVVLIDHQPTTADKARSISAEVGIVTFGPRETRYGVERIHLRSACPAAWLPSLVRRVIRGDLPTSIWWVDDLSQHPPEPPIVAMGRQLVYDSRQWDDVTRGVLALGPHIREREASTPRAERVMTESRHVDLADLNWRRLTPLRSALACAAENSDSTLWQPEQMRVTHRPGDAALAWLLVGWLASRLEWPFATHPPVAETKHAGDVVTVTIGAGRDELRAVLDERRVMITRAGETRSAMGVPQEGEADAVAAELHALSHDACLHDALSALLRIFRAA
jgi:glucose-6-phosphate dehydrogenase assembly protein OpcA